MSGPSRDVQLRQTGFLACSVQAPYTGIDRKSGRQGENALLPHSPYRRNIRPVNFRYTKWEIERDVSLRQIVPYRDQPPRPSVWESPEPCRPKSWAREPPQNSHSLWVGHQCAEEWLVSHVAMSSEIRLSAVSLTYGPPQVLESRDGCRVTIAANGRSLSEAHRPGAEAPRMVPCDRPWEPRIPTRRALDSAPFWQTAPWAEGTSDSHGTRFSRLAAARLGRVRLKQLGPCLGHCGVDRATGGYERCLGFLDSGQAVQGDGWLVVSARTVTSLGVLSATAGEAVRGNPASSFRDGRLPNWLSHLARRVRH